MGIEEFGKEAEIEFATAKDIIGHLSAIQDHHTIGYEAGIKLNVDADEANRILCRSVRTLCIEESKELQAKIQGILDGEFYVENGVQIIGD